jgi:hypothetical protein
VKTRRSPRNQEILWRILGPKPAAPVKRTKLCSRAEARRILLKDKA